MIGAIIKNVNVDDEANYVRDMTGFEMRIAGRQRIRIEIELTEFGSDEERRWFLDSIKKNGGRLRLKPDGSPIVRPDSAPLSSWGGDRPAESKDYW